jgi:hypothetical protein
MSIQVSPPGHKKPQGSLNRLPASFFSVFFVLRALSDLMPVCAIDYEVVYSIGLL